MTSQYVLDELCGHERVCSNCWRLRHEHTPPPVRITGKQTVTADCAVGYWSRTIPAEKDAPDPAETVSEGAERTVCDCGAFSAYLCSLQRREDPPTRSELIGYAKNVSTTLDALADEEYRNGAIYRANRYAHDVDTLFSVVRSLKKRPEYQCRDYDILRSGTELATRRVDEYETKTPDRNPGKSGRRPRDA